jgi:hypothetical protein
MVIARLNVKPPGLGIRIGLKFRHCGQMQREWIFESALCQFDNLFRNERGHGVGAVLNPRAFPITSTVSGSNA